MNSLSESVERQRGRPLLDSQPCRGLRLPGVDETLLGIGQMAQRSGLTVSALRFYAGASMLEPDGVDPGTGYRRYRPAQLRQARRVVVACDDSAEVSRIIEEHLRRLEAGLADAKRVLSATSRLRRSRGSTVHLRVSTSSAEPGRGGSRGAAPSWTIPAAP